MRCAGYVIPNSTWSEVFSADIIDFSDETSIRSIVPAQLRQGGTSSTTETRGSFRVVVVNF